MEIKIVRPSTKGSNLKVFESEKTFNKFDKKKEKSCSELLSELNDLVGLESVKELVFELTAFIEIQKRRQLENLVSEPLVLHMIFKGNPGTGKTTVARILGKIFKQMNVLSKGHLIEIERADLVGEYIGHTAQKTREQIKKAIGGILFIDEAYSLARGGERDFGKEAIDVMVKAMEDNKDNLILILTGYKNEMNEFIRSNPGIKSRFPIQIDFPDYTVAELLEIADIMLKKRQYTLTSSAKEALKRELELQTGRGYEHSGNARLVRNIIEKAIRRQAVRLVNKPNLTREDMILITKEDISKISREQILPKISQGEVI